MEEPQLQQQMDEEDENQAIAGAGDNIVMGGEAEENAEGEDQAMDRDELGQSQGDQQQTGANQQVVGMPMDAEQEYAEMDYKICGELCK